MKKRTKIIIISLISIVVLAFTFIKVQRISPLSWEYNEINQPMFSDVAINSYDAVAYFSKNNAVLGNATHSYKWKNATWFFSTEENKSLFKEYPERYAPQFGGYCAFAVSKGFTANTDPNSFEIINDKLYLFADNDVKKDWKANLEENLKKCELNWK